MSNVFLLVHFHIKYFLTAHRTDSFGVAAFLTVIVHLLHVGLLTNAALRTRRVEALLLLHALEQSHVQA